MRWMLLLTLLACRDRTPPLPDCDDMNETVVGACAVPAPLDCETASDELIRCVERVATEATVCPSLRQSIARCIVKHNYRDERWD
jgi:tellurite resistance protein